MHALCVYCLEENTDRNRWVNSINKLNQDFKILHVTGLPLHPLFLLLIVTGVHLSKCCIGLFLGRRVQSPREVRIWPVDLKGTFPCVLRLRSPAFSFRDVRSGLLFPPCENCFAQKHNVLESDYLPTLPRVRGKPFHTERQGYRET